MPLNGVNLPAIWLVCLVIFFLMGLASALYFNQYIQNRDPKTYIKYCILGAASSIVIFIPFFAKVWPNREIYFVALPVLGILLLYEINILKALIRLSNR